MARQSITPSRNRSISQRPRDADPVLELRRDMNRVFEDFFRGFGLPSLLGGRDADTAPMLLTPRIDVSETDQDIRIAVELPGIDPDEVDVMISDDTVTIRGTKRTDREKGDRDYFVVERAEGTFARSLALPFSIDPGQVQASFRNGVLTINIPKPQEAQGKVHRIDVMREEGAGGQQTRMMDRAAAGNKPAAGNQQPLGDQPAGEPSPAAGEAAQGTAAGSASPGSGRTAG